MQYVWDQRYIDDLLVHREDSDASGSYDETWYHLTDVQYSTVAILDDAAALVERVSYDAYGKARHHYMADWDGSGGVTQSEIDQIQTIADGSDHAIGETNYNPDMDNDRNGDIQTADFTIANNEGTHSALATGLISDPSVDSQIGWDGYVFNAETRQYLHALLIQDSMNAAVQRLCLSVFICGSIDRLEIVGLAVGVFPDRHVKMAHTPLQGLFVRWEQHVEMVAFDRTATIQDRHDVAIVIPGDREHRTEGEQRGVGGDEFHAIGFD